ncbi:MAG: CsgG/HfaB family protein [Thermodesulfobacteriota bacterium]
MNMIADHASWKKILFGLTFVIGVLLLIPPASVAAEEFDIPLGSAYQGAKCMAAVEDFAMEVPGAPDDVKNGLQEMLQTALFESNYFILVDRSDPQGISAELLLSDSFMADPDTILEQGQLDPAEVMIYGTLTALEGGGAGLRVKAPWIPLTVGGTYHEARADIDVRAVDAASGQVIATAHFSGSASSGKSSTAAVFTGVKMPAQLEMFVNTPLELCLRDCIYRSVVELCKTIPPQYFKH